MYFSASLTVNKSWKYTEQRKLRMFVHAKQVDGLNEKCQSSMSF